MNGVLVIDKPQGPTSFEVVRRVKAALGSKRAGHTGTLDPMATGVLPVCLGEATKLAGLLTEGDKAYDAVVRLGVVTDTQDVTGAVLETRPVPPLIRRAARGGAGALPRDVLPAAADVLGGEGGGEATLRARACRRVRRAHPEASHGVTRSCSGTSPPSECTLSVRCSKGFFVRTLADDLGRALGVRRRT